MEELIDALPDTALPDSPVGRMMEAAIQAKIAEKLAAPRKWAIGAVIFAGVSAGAAVVSAIAAF